MDSFTAHTSCILLPACCPSDSRTESRLALEAQAGPRIPDSLQANSKLMKATTSPFPASSGSSRASISSGWPRASSTGRRGSPAVGGRCSAGRSTRPPSGRPGPRRGARTATGCGRSGRGIPTPSSRRPWSSRPSSCGSSGASGGVGGPTTRARSAGGQARPCGSGTPTAAPFPGERERALTTWRGLRATSGGTEAPLSGFRRSD